MKVLVVCSNAALRRSIVHAFVDAGHHPYVLGDDSSGDDEYSSANVQAIAADTPSTVYDAVRGCDAAVVVEPSVTSPANADSGLPDLIERALREAGASGLRRLVRVVGRSSRRMEAKRESSEYDHESVTVVSAPVYGITDDPITLFLIMMRSLPVVPILGATHALRPVWHADLARALAMLLELPSSELAPEFRIEGPDRVTQADLYERIAAIIDRHPRRVPVPHFLAAHGAAVADALKWRMPFEVSHLPFAHGDDDEVRGHILASPFGVSATTLDEGLRRVVRELEELPPSEGVGTLEVKRFWVDVEAPRYGAVDLLDLFRRRFRDVMPIVVGVEPAAPGTTLNEDAVVTMALPGRGHVQVRVEEVADDHVIVATLRGHAVAGIVRFSTRTLPRAVRFEVMTCDRAANALDWLGLTLGGSRLQDANWTRVVENVAALAGGTPGPVESDARRLGKDEARGAERWIGDLIERHRARQAPPASPQSATS